MPYNKSKLSKEQIHAGKRIFNLLHMTLPWVMLIAQMQSGKTGTFLLAAAEMLREEKISHVIIICGNSEKDLKNQLEKDIKEFIVKYRNYLKDELNISEDEQAVILNRIEESIVTKSGAELEAKHDETTECKNTLFIWEESHFGSGQSNRPNKYLERRGIRADGTRACLDERNNKVLTVSATGFSEISDQHHEKQQKEIVRLKPGAGYRGIGYYLRNNNIIGFKYWKTTLERILRGKYAGVEKKYAIVRVNGNVNMEEGKRIAIKNGWAYKVFDADEVNYAKKNNDRSAMISMDELDIEPTKNTIIFIRQMCRMGKVVPKQHIVFVMETASSPKSDALLQGLPGRVCGYGIEGEIDIYINEDILTKKTGNNTTELEKFVKLMENEDEEITSIPTKATHLKSSTRDSVYDLLPIKVSGFVEDREDPNYSEFNNDLIKQIVREKILLGEEEGVDNPNGPKHTAELRKQLADAETYIEIHKMVKQSNGEENTTFKEVPQKCADILRGIEKLNAVRRLPGCGLNKKDATQINVYYMNDNKYARLGFPRGTIIVQAACKISEDGVYMPMTTGKEAFTSKREDQTEIVSNGVCAIKLNIDSSTSVENMQKGLEEIIKLSLMPRSVVTIDRCITSVCGSDGKWQGILVNEVVYKALLKRGSIFNYLKDNCGVTLKISCKRGPSTKACKESGHKRLCKIEW